MRLDLRKIIHVPGASFPYDFQLDLTHLDFFGARPITRPIQVQGQVTNRGGALVLEGAATTVLDLTCDRCCKAYQAEKSVPLDSLLATELEDEDSEDEIILLEGGMLDLDEVATTAFVLDMDTKNLCSEDCKGLCGRCGANLNLGPCTCKSDVDPRLAALAQLLDDES